MLKLTKKADYGLIALRHLTMVAEEAATAGTHPGMGRIGANGVPRGSASAKDIADAYGVPLPLLSKVLQKLARAGILSSEQGTNGGYRLAREAEKISALEVIRAIDGPIILTQCFTEHRQPDGRSCDQTGLCPVREPLRKVHEGILGLLSNISMSDLSNDDMAVPAYSPRPMALSHIKLAVPQFAVAQKDVLPNVKAADGVTSSAPIFGDAVYGEKLPEGLRETEEVAR
jgi:Rrf2 family protein